MTLTPESIGRALDGLDDDERAELARIIADTLEALPPAANAFDAGLRDRFLSVLPLD